MQLTGDLNELYRMNANVMHKCDQEANDRTAISCSTPGIMWCIIGIASSTPGVMRCINDVLFGLFTVDQIAAL